VTFDASTLVIPDLSWRTTTLFFVPIPPPLNIAITPKRLEVSATGEPVAQLIRFMVAVARPKVASCSKHQGATLSLAESLAVPCCCAVCWQGVINTLTGEVNLEFGKPQKECVCELIMMKACVSSC
jgi:hypothetical protein